MDPAYSKEYDAYERRHWWSVARREIIHAMLDRYAPGASAGKGRWLDVGCATGVMLGTYRGFAEKIGAELDPATVERGRAEGRDIRSIDATWDFSAFGLFDCISLFDVLEHVGQEQPALAAVYGALKDGGTLLITVPALMSLWSEHDVVNHHFRRYRAGELLSRFPADRWDVVKLTYFSTLLFPPIWCVRQGRRLLRRLGGSDPGKPPKHDVRFGNPLIDGVLKNIFRMEKPLLKHLWLPIGSSLLLILRKRAD